MSLWRPGDVSHALATTRPCRGGTAALGCGMEVWDAFRLGHVPSVTLNNGMSPLGTAAPSLPAGAFGHCLCGMSVVGRWLCRGLWSLGLKQGKPQPWGCGNDFPPGLGKTKLLEDAAGLQQWQTQTWWHFVTCGNFSSLHCWILQGNDFMHTGVVL